MAVDISGTTVTQPPSAQGRVPQHDYVILIWLFWAFAITTLLIRLVVQARKRKVFQIDDYLLVFAAICLTTATIFMQIRNPDFYAVAALTADPNNGGSDIAQIILRFQIVYFTYNPLIWTTIFATKFSYLFFFRRLVDRVRPKVIYWWIVTTFCVVSYILCLLQPYVSCPHMDYRVFDEGFIKTFHSYIASVVLDIATDIMIVSIPICLLSKLKVRTSQKLGLATCLCLSGIMAVIAVIRVSGLRAGKVNVGSPTSTATHHAREGVGSGWQYLWAQIEGSVAICLVSSTAFRFLFVQSEGSSTSHSHNSARQWYKSTIKKLHFRKHEDEEIKQLSQVPTGSMSGTHTFIWGGKDNNKSSSTMHGEMTLLHSRASDEQSQRSMEQEKRDSSKIYVARSFQTVVHEINDPKSPQPTTPIHLISRYNPYGIPERGSSREMTTTHHAPPPISTPIIILPEPERTSPSFSSSYVSRPNPDHDNSGNGHTVYEV